MIPIVRICVVVYATVLATYDDREAYFLSRGFQEDNGVASFFRSKEMRQLELLSFHKSPRISIYAAWILSQRQSLEMSEVSHQRNSRHEFLGFLTAKINFKIPEWWKQSITEFRLSDGYVAPNRKIIDNWVDGLNSKHTVACSDDINVISLSAKRVSFTVNNREVDIRQMGQSWDVDDRFIGDYPCFLAFAEVEKRFRIVGIADKYQSEFEVYCVSPDGSKLWSATVESMNQYSVGGTLPSTNGLMHFETNADQLAIFWVNESAISLTIVSIDTGEIATRFTTAFSLRP